MMMMTMTMMMMMMISTCCWLAPPRSPSPAFSPTSSPTHPGSTSTWGEEGDEVHGNGFCLNDLYIPSPKCTSTFSTLSSFIIFWSHLDSKCHHWQLCNGAERKLWWQEDGWGEKLTTYTLPSLTSLLATVLHKLPALVGARTETNQHSRCISFRDKSYEPNRSHGGFTFATKKRNQPQPQPPYHFHCHPHLCHHHLHHFQAECLSHGFSSQVFTNPHLPYADA